ncbi:MAG TPA: TonB-dependent receptor [Verrucomicrobiae bacterium]|nr:TonB-dependent receptor [Verrucomicrobiae bacterium]
MKLGFASSSVLFLVLSVMTPPTLAQDPAGDDTQELEALEVTGSRIKKTGTEGQTPVMSLSRDQLEATGISSIGDILQRLSVAGSSLNTKFNSAGNFGFPADSGGVGSGSTTISLRNLGAKRVLVLVDGLRWVNESSASGVSGAVDLNTIPFSAVERVEILTDGASSLYGSDAIAGVVNIITRKTQDGAELRAYGGDHRTGDGATTAGSLTLGGSQGRTRFFFDLDYFDQDSISSDETEQSRFPVPGTGVAFGSSAIPHTRSVFVEPSDNLHGGLCSFTTDTNADDVPDAPPVVCNIAGNGTAAGPSFTPAFPAGFHPFDGGVAGDRFNFARYNLLLTPSERSAIFMNVSHEVLDDVSLYLKGLYQGRESVNQAAPEPIFIGPGAGTGGLADTISVDVTNPFNPFGYTLDAGSNLIFAARRPLEGGPRVFTQNVATRYVSGGLQGGFGVGTRHWLWDANLISSVNRAEQTVEGTYNIAHIAQALGPVANCTAPCVPLNFFGGPGTITPAMLAYIGFRELDRSEQKLNAYTGNMSGPIMPLPAGPLEFAVGIEHRKLGASYSPDSVVTAGETNGVPSQATAGSYAVDEAYVELSVPILAGMAAARSLDLSLASRISDYSTFGRETNSKFGVRWEATEDWVARATFAEGFRAPSVGELFGSPARFDATITDPCNLLPNTDPNFTNCQNLGVANPTAFEQANTQISVRTGGNRELEPETADSFTAGLVYSPSWAENQAWANRLDFELTFYKHEIEDAIQAPDAQTQLNRCVESGDPASSFCTGITRGSSGDINAFNNTLRNLGTIDTQGYDVGVDWAGPALGTGRVGADWQLTYVDKYTATSSDTGLEEPRMVGVEVTDSGIPRVRSSLRMSWAMSVVDLGWTVRYLSRLTETCDQDRIDLGVCSDPGSGTNELEAVFYNDIRAAFRLPAIRATLAAGINNVLDQDPPVCVTCSLNGHDASNYDLPGQFGYLEARVGF